MGSKKQSHMVNQEVIEEDSMSRKVNVKRLKKACRDQKKRIKYKEAKIVYLERMNELLAGNKVEKMIHSVIRELNEREIGNVRTLCTVAGVSEKCYSATLHSIERSETDMRILEIIRRVQA